MYQKKVMKSKAKQLGLVLRRGMIEFAALACLMIVSVCGGIAQVDVDTSFGIEATEMALDGECGKSKELI